MVKASKITHEHPPGFKYYPDFLTPKEESSLIKYFEKLKWESVKMHGIVAKRRVVHFGYDYHYSKKSVVKTKPVPRYIKKYINRAAQLLGMDKNQFVEVLITEYPEGAGIGWHRDAKIFGDVVFGISLLNQGTMKLKQIRDKNSIYKINLDPRSAYVISGACRDEWYHSVSPVKMKRYSITLRTFRHI